MISIIIPLYNRADKISGLLDTLFQQTYRDFEVIIVNDGSQDGPEKVLNEYLDGLKPTQRFLVINQKNAGAPAARNRGLREARGEYLFFCDADALLIPEALELMLAELEAHAEASYAYASFWWGFKLFRLGPFDAERLKKMPCTHTMSLIRRGDFPAGGWDESVKRLQDWDLWLTFLENGKTGRWLDRPLFKIRPGGVISSRWFPKIFYKIFPFLPSVKKYNQAVATVKAKHGLA